ncbi:MAG: hypothetical protein ACREAS_07920 [Nitrososphaera sp.]
MHSNKHLTVILSLLVTTSSLITVLLSIITTANTYATILSKEDPPLLIEGSSGQNQSVDELDIDVAVDPSELLPPNGTQQISTEEQLTLTLITFLL